MFMYYKGVSIWIDCSLIAFPCHVSTGHGPNHRGIETLTIHNVTERLLCSDHKKCKRPFLVRFFRLELCPSWIDFSHVICLQVIVWQCIMVVCSTFMVLCPEDSLFLQISCLSILIGFGSDLLISWMWYLLSDPYIHTLQQCNLYRL